jgi:hypothetical protein
MITLKDYSPDDLLNTPMLTNDAKAKTVRVYLVTLLLHVWRDGENFDGKRPFGNSGWWTELGEAFMHAGYARGGEEDGEPDYDETDALVRTALVELREPSV